MTCGCVHEATISVPVGLWYWYDSNSTINRSRQSAKISKLSAAWYDYLSRKLAAEFSEVKETKAKVQAALSWA